MRLPFISFSPHQPTPGLSPHSILHSPQRQRATGLASFIRAICILLLLGLTSMSAWAQCSGRIVLSSQAQVDAFPSTCTISIYDGSIRIEGADITDLSPLRNLQVITGDFVITNNPELTSLTGLENLARSFTLGIIGNAKLTSLAGLSSFASSFGDVRIEANPELTSLAGLENLASIGGLVIVNNTKLASLAALRSLSKVKGGVRIDDNPELTSLTGLENLSFTSTGFGGLDIKGNAKLTSLAVMSSLTEVRFTLRIDDNPELTSLEGLENLARIGDLEINRNAKLTSLAGLSSFTSCGGTVRIEANPGLTSLTGLENLTRSGRLDIVRNAKLTSLAGLRSFTSCGGMVRIEANPELTSLAGLENLTTAGGLDILSNTKLTSLAGLSGFTSCGGTVRIEANPELTSLAGLEQLTSIGGQLAILNNARLTTCAIASICQFLAAPPPGGITIGGNASGCASVAQVQANCSPLAVTGFAASPDAVCVGSPVTFTATVGNATTPYNFTITNGSNTTMGTASTSAFSQSLVASGSGNQSFTLTVSSEGRTATATATATVTVNPLPVVNNPMVTTATQGQPFSQPFTASGGSSPYSYSLGDGSLPPGLSLTQGGLLEGSPSQVGSFSLSVRASDALGCVGAGGPYTLTVITTPTVTTEAPATIQGTSATLGGNVTADGNAPVTERGVVYLTGTGTPTTNDSKVIIGAGVGSFSQTVTGLSSNTNYSVRAYAINAAGTSYGNVQTFTTPAPPAAPVVVTPANGSRLNDTTPDYAGTGIPNSNVTVFVDGSMAGTTVADANGNWRLTSPTELASGSHTIYAVVTRNDLTSPNSNTNTFVVDITRPTVTVSSTEPSPTNISPIPFTFSFSESVTGMTASDITVTNGTVAANSFSGSGATYTLTITPTASGPVQVSVAANVAQDAAGNGNQASSVFSIEYAPAVMLANFGASLPAVCDGNPVTFTATVSNARGSYTYTLTNGSGTSVTGTSSTSAFSQSVVASGSGSQRFTLTVSNEGQTATATTDVTVNALPTANLANNGPLSCSMTSVMLTASGGDAYRFSAGANQINGGNTASVNTAGTYSVTVTNANGCSTTAQTTVTGDLTPPTASINPTTATLTCTNPTAMLTASGEGTYRWEDNSTNPVRTVSSAGTYSVTVTSANGCTATASSVVTGESNTPPMITTLTVGTGPQAINTAFAFSAQVSDATNNLTTASIAWGDGSTTTLTPAAGGGTLSATHAYTAARVYRVSLTLTDACGATANQVYEFAVAYDPAAGFVTGAGWIESPAGAYSVNPTLTGKANFGFQAKYQKGATVPTGNTNFQFKAGSLDFESTVYEWLTVAGARAQFKGSGTINGAGDYGFMLTAIDGEINGGGGTDKFRIKIWQKQGGAIVYDNQRNAADDAALSTVIGGGQIVIHTPNGRNAREASSIEPTLTAEGLLLRNYPNPIGQQTLIEFMLPQGGDYSLLIVDTKGSLVRQLQSGTAQAGQLHQVSWEVGQTPAGLYITQLITPQGVKAIKLLVK